MRTSFAISTYTYAETNANPHAVTSVGGTTYTYDNNGNATAIGSLDYTWDWRNRLASAERSGVATTSYGYDHTGQRVFQAMGSATTSYPNRYYNVASSSLTATTTKHILSPDGTLLATVVGTGTSTASTTSLHPDHLGGTNVATDQDGEVVQILDYYPYGSQRIATGSFDEQRREAIRPLQSLFPQLVISSVVRSSWTHGAALLKRAVHRPGHHRGASEPREQPCLPWLMAGAWSEARRRPQSAPLAPYRSRTTRYPGTSFAGRSSPPSPPASARG